MFNCITNDFSFAISLTIFFYLFSIVIKKNTLDVCRRKIILYRKCKIKTRTITNDYLNLGLKFFYWRDKNGREVDLLLARNVTTPVVAIEIKSSENPEPEDCPGFDSFREDYPDIPRICICRTPRAYQRGGIVFLPWQESIKDLNQILKPTGIQ